MPSPQKPLVAVFGMHTAHAAHHEALAGVSGGGPAVERLAVVAVLQAYLRGAEQRDPAALRQAIHPGALLHAASPTGTLRAVTRDEWGARLSRQPTRAQRHRGTITLVEVAATAALARIDGFDAKGRPRADLLTLHKTGDGWRIVGRVAPW